MKTIRLWRSARPETLVLEEAGSGALGRGEVRVRVRAASLNFRDALVVDGVFPSPDGIVPLSDGAGEVIEAGPDVAGLAVGDRVVSLFHPNWRDGHADRAELNNTPGGPADGFACEEVIRPASHFTRAPANLSDVEAACLGCAGVTAWRAVVTDGQVRPGEVVVVQGTGGVSLFALQFAKAAGATVIATSSSPDKLARLRALGADHVLDYKAEPEWGRAVLELTGGLGAEHVVEIGGPSTLGQSFLSARTGGHIALIGASGGFAMDAMPFAVVQAKRLRLQAVGVGSRRDQVDMIRAIEAHDLHPVIDTTYPLERIGEAFARLRSGGHVGKVCLTIGE